MAKGLGPANPPDLSKIRAGFFNLPQEDKEAAYATVGGFMNFLDLEPAERAKVCAHAVEEYDRHQP
jgi:hypothetical protein